MKKRKKHYLVSMEAGIDGVAHIGKENHIDLYYAENIKNRRNFKVNIIKVWR